MTSTELTAGPVPEDDLKKIYFVDAVGSLLGIYENSRQRGKTLNWEEVHFALVTYRK